MTKISNLYALTNYIYGDSSGNVGIGTITPTNKLTVNYNSSFTGTPAPPTTGGGINLIASDGASIALSLDTFGASNPQITFRRSLGTLTTPTALTTDSSLGAITWRGYGATGYATGNRGLINLFASENWTDTAQGTYMTFNTVTGGTTSSVERMRISSTGAATFSSSVTATSFISDGVSSEGSIRVERDTVSANTVIGSLNFTNNNGATTYGKVFGGRNSAGDGYIALGTGVSNNLYALENGNIGIGTASPIAYQNYRYLQIDGASTTQGGVVRLRTSDGSYVNEFAVDSGGGYISSSAAFQIYVNNSPRLYINTSGNVGIGTTSPYSKLTIHSTASTTLGLNSQSGLVIGQGGATNDLIQIGFNQAVSSTYSPAAISYLITNSGASTLGDILFSTRTSISDIAPSERMRITSGGDIEVNGGAIRANGGYVRLASSGGATTGGYFLRKASWLGTGTDHSPSIAAEGGYGINFYTNGATSERMIINASGNVSVTNLLYADRLSLSGYPTLYGTKVVKADAVTSASFNLASMFPEISSNFSGGNVVGAFGRYTIFRGGTAETGMFSISRNSSGTWSSGSFSSQTCTGAYSLSSVTGSGNSTLVFSFNTAVYVMAEITVMIE